MINIKDQLDDNNNITLIFEGNLDENTCKSVEQKFNEVLSGQSKIIYLNMKGVKYISSIGIRVLMIAHNKSIKSNKKIVIKREDMSTKAREILEIVGILPLFEDAKE